MKEILIVEDESSIREFEVINLRRVGYKVYEVESGERALEVFNEHGPSIDIVILDIVLPGMSGAEVCKEIRLKNEEVGLIILTSKVQEIDKISGLMYGADDYITKPFSPSEFVARVDALYRRVVLNSIRISQKFSEEITSGDFVLNLRRHTLKKKGKNIETTQNEFQIMEYFLSNSNTNLSRKQILDHVWNDIENKDEKIVDVNVRRLRLKVEDDPARPKHIITVWGVGYRWE
ncbi:MAG: response regulator transcription factor [Oscillospiraceae bacterium]|jgi:DNA-binding response OmpR family regulator|nr:response regulator transcription factor [Oscillospiraceae bacterium]